MPTPDAITTILAVGMVVRYVQPSNGVRVRGQIVEILRHRGQPWLHVVRVKDAAHVVVGLHQVVALLSTVPVIEAVPVEEVVEVETPVQVLERTIPVLPITTTVFRTSLFGAARVDDTVRFLSPYGTVKVGVVRELDTVSALIETADDLELVDVTDIRAVLAA